MAQFIKLFVLQLDSFYYHMSTLQIRKFKHRLTKLDQKK